MYCFAAVLALALALGLTPAGLSAGERPSAAALKQLGPFGTVESINRFIHDYREHPRPLMLPALMRSAIALGLTRDLDSAGVYIGFAGGVLGANRDAAEKLVGLMFPLEPEDQVVVVRAIAASGLPNWKTLMAKFAERMPARQAMIQHYVTGQLKPLSEMPLEQGPTGIDMLWGQYYATGGFEPVLRMVSILPWAKLDNDLDKVTAGATVKFTLAANGTRDKTLLDMLKAALNAEPKETIGGLREVIEAAETFETQKLRREALAAVDKVRARGFAKSEPSPWQKWGQIGQKVMAVGCVAASALGQAEVGIPCVIGGAATSAALKALPP